MSGTRNLTHERLTEVLSADPATGVFRWRVRPSNRVHVGDRAGVVGVTGHRFITIDGEKLLASRLAWFYAHGVWPTGDIKMLNGNPDDCSLANLREVSRIEQARLRGALSTNTSGLRGVSPTRRGKWKASITANYHQVMLGVFDTKEQASEVYEHAMSLLAGAKTPAECDAAIEHVIQHRRKCVAWNRLQRSGRPHSWPSFEQFSADIGDVAEDESTVAAIDQSQPISASNFRWLLRVHETFDRNTKEGRAAYALAYRKANPGRWRHTHLKNNYGIDEVEYQRRLQEQGAVCAICKKPETEFRGSANRVLSVDHDHNTGKARGLLCGNCNQGLGYFGDDRDLLLVAATYLEKHSRARNVCSESE
jgi:Recombination endonuclease VII/HNH endonuclease